MFANPFSPIFGGRPECFFGRKGILAAFDLAMVDRGSEDRALLVTGTRGSGKTALLEQFSRRAAQRGRRVIDLGPDGTVEQLVRKLAKHDEVTRTISPQVSVSIMGMGDGLSAGSVSHTTRYGREDLQDLLLDACAREQNGILVTIDEIQKLALDDVSLICNAFQMASRKGNDIMLAAAGLPYAHGRIIRHEGCTFLRRAAHEEIGLFGWDEAQEALEEAFSLVKGLHVGDAELARLNEASYGHPYLMQLMGYCLIVQANERSVREPVSDVSGLLGEAIEQAVMAYERRALLPMVGELSGTEVEYLRAMSGLLNENRIAKAGDIARKLGREQRQLSYARAELINKGIIASPSYGNLVFCVPYLASYLQKDGGADAVLHIVRERRV